MSATAESLGRKLHTYLLERKAETDGKFSFSNGSSSPSAFEEPRSTSTLRPSLALRVDDGTELIARYGFRGKDALVQLELTVIKSQPNGETSPVQKSYRVNIHGATTAAEHLDQVARGVLALHAPKHRGGEARATTKRGAAAQSSNITLDKNDNSAALCPWGARVATSPLQWHTNACGYYALFNAYRLLSASGPESIDGEDAHAVDIWSRTMAGLDSLKAEQVKNKRWNKVELESLILDDSHIEHIVREVERSSSDQVTIVQNGASDFDWEDFQKPFVESLKANKPHAFIIAAYAHWLSAVWMNNELVILDSFNKPYDQLLRVACSEGRSSESFRNSLRVLADAHIESYRDTFKAKLRATEAKRFGEAPEYILDNAFNEGVVEYWRGEPKDPIWWQHRPFCVRKEILMTEMRHAVAVFMRILTIATETLGRDELVATERLLPMPASDFFNRDQLIAQLGSVFPVKPDSSRVPARTDCTATVKGLASFVRRDQDLGPGDANYDPSSEPSLMTRKRPPPEEIPGDVFDRQRVVVGFDQGLVERQTCLVLGTGGIGQNVALNLARLGVKRIVLLDSDIYDASNLTRQCLGRYRDIGTPKVEAAARNIRHHNLRSEIRTVQLDMLTQWNLVVEEARGASVIFNCCDAGLMFDFAVNALSKELDLPLLVGQSFGWKYMSEIYSGGAGENCGFCAESTLSTFSANLSGATRVWNRLLAFAHDGSTQASLKDAVVSRPSETEFAALVRDFLCRDPGFRLLRGADASADEEQLAFFLPLIRATQWSSPTDVLAFLTRFHHRVVSDMLLPGSVSRQTRIGSYAPRPLSPDTRFVGSWIVPCLACGVAMVGQWMSYLSAPPGHEIGTTILFNVDEGTTSNEQMAYECGLALDRASRSLVRSPSRPDCGVCRAARERRATREAFYGEHEVWLRPAEGGETLAATRFKTGKSVTSGELSDGAGARVALPEIPARDSVVDVGVGEEDAASWPGDSLPPGVALVKTEREETLRWPSRIRAHQSGRRSCVVVNERARTAYRLKGCGDLRRGFPTLKLAEDASAPLTLRGCMFETTCARELHMCGVVERVLRDADEVGAASASMLAGNRAVGFYRYPRERPSEFAGAWALAESVTRFCGVFETVGDRRLGDHLIQGLLRLLSKRAEGVSREVLEETSTADRVECGLPVVDYAGARIRWARGGGRASEPHGTSSRTAILWSKAFPGGAEEEEDDDAGLVLRFVRRLGKECGHALRALHRARICWGTYRDALGSHCNAHANNFVVRANHRPSRGALRFLAPLDFDMAFTAESYLPERARSAGREGASFFPVDFDELLVFEREMGMRPSLAGSDFTNTGVTGSKTAESGNPELNGLLRVVVYDTLVAGFDSAVSGGEEKDVEDDEADVARMWALAELALDETKSIWV